MIKLYKVNGYSMSPLLNHGDILLFKTRFKFKRIVPGMIVAVEHLRLGKIIKRVVSVESDYILLEGDNIQSTSTSIIGKVPKNNVLGVFLKRINFLSFKKY